VRYPVLNARSAGCKKIGSASSLNLHPSLGNEGKRLNEDSADQFSTQQL
jgi:hypothetical protein